jgi:hypothetical protein
MVAYAAIPIGAAVGAVASSVLTVPEIIVASGLFVSIFGLACLTVSRRELRVQLMAAGMQPTAGSTVK